MVIKRPKTKATRTQGTIERVSLEIKGLISFSRRELRGGLRRVGEFTARMLKLRPKALFDFLWRLRRKSPPNLWHFGRAVRDVIGARMLRAITGELSVAEAWRMVEEKRRAAVQASFAYTEAILNGQAASALRAYFDVYRRAVESNRKRLSIRRWRWPWLR